MQAKLSGQAGVKYAAVASHAAGEGRRGLAALLLEHERVAAEQVPLLLNLGRGCGGVVAEEGRRNEWCCGTRDVLLCVHSLRPALVPSRVMHCCACTPDGQC